MQQQQRRQHQMQQQHHQHHQQHHQHHQQHHQPLFPHMQVQIKQPTIDVEEALQTQKYQRNYLTQLNLNSINNVPVQKQFIETHHQPHHQQIRIAAAPTNTTTS